MSIDAHVRWRTIVPGDGGHRLWQDTDDNAVLVGDGWGIAWAALRLRALDLEDGHERLSTRLGNAVRAMTRDADGHWLAATDGRLFKLDRSTLRPTTKWAKRIPRYADELVAGGGFVHFANHVSPTLHAMDLKHGVVRRRLIGGAVRIHSNGKQLIATSSSGGVFLADFGLGAGPRQIAEADTVGGSSADRNGRVWLSLGDGLRRTGKQLIRPEPTSRLGWLDVYPCSGLTEVDLGLPFLELAATLDGSMVAVLGLSACIGPDEPAYQHREIACFRTSDYRCVSRTRVPEGHEIKLICPDQMTAFAAKASGEQNRLETELVCLNLCPSK